MQLSVIADSFVYNDELLHLEMILYVNKGEHFDAMAPILAKSLNRLSREAIIDLALAWLQDERSLAPYLLCNRTGFEADEEDYLHTPAESIEKLREFYETLRKDQSQATKRDIIDRIVDGDWRRGLSLHQHAIIDFANLEQHDTALKWSALKLVPLEAGQEKSAFEDDSQPAKKKRKLSHEEEPPYPQVSPQAFLSTLKAEISPLVKAHYHLHLMPSPYNLTILRLYISPNSAFTPRRSKVPRRAKHATDSGRIMYIAIPDSCPYIYVSVSSSPSTSSSRSKSSTRDIKEKVLAKVDMAAMKRIVLEAIPKALSRPHQRWSLESTKLVARSLQTMCELRGNQKPGTGGGAYSIFADGSKSADISPVDVNMGEDEDKDEKDHEEEGPDDRQDLIDRRFGHMSGEHYAALDRVHVKLRNVIPPSDDDDGDGDGDTNLTQRCAPEAEDGEDEGNEIFLTFSGTDVFRGLKTLAELSPSYIDLQKMPGWMTGELGVSSLVV